MPLLTAGEFNQGVKEFISNQNQQIFNNAITIDMFCNSFVHIEKFCCDDNILVLNPKELMNKYHLRFISTIINKDKSKYGYGKQYRIGSLENHKISLPTIDSAIAFEFMENYIKELEAERIKELEAERIKELEAYLQVTGLKNYTLSAKEKEALNAFEAAQNERERERVSGTPLKWREFKIGELFSVKSNPQLNKDSFEFAENGEYPYFTRTCLNNGINGYVNYLDEEHKIKGNGLAVGMLGMQFFYMQKDFYAGQFTKTCYPKFKRFNQKIAHFFITYLNKQQSQFQAVLVRDFEKTFNETKILLPINQNNQITFEFMENFISAVQKEVIKSVVLWSEKRLNATKQVISKSL